MAWKLLKKFHEDIDSKSQSLLNIQLKILFHRGRSPASFPPLLINVIISQHRGARARGFLTHFPDPEALSSIVDKIKATIQTTAMMKTPVPTCRTVVAIVVQHFSRKKEQFMEIPPA